jgi:hypothetical protein
MLRSFERMILRRILRRIYGPIKENGLWRSWYNHELYELYNAPDTVKVINEFLECRSRTLAAS